MLSFFPRDVLDEIFNLIELVSEGFPSCSSVNHIRRTQAIVLRSPTTSLSGLGVIEV